MPPALNEHQMDFLRMLEAEFGSRITTAGDFRKQMRTLGFEDWEIDEYIDDMEADEP